MLEAGVVERRGQAPTGRQLVTERGQWTDGWA